MRPYPNTTLALRRRDLHRDLISTVTLKMQLIYATCCLRSAHCKATLHEVCRVMGLNFNAQRNGVSSCSSDRLTCQVASKAGSISAGSEGEEKPLSLC